jgi:PhnB protein
MQVHPYVYFDGRCEEALAFYRSALGAEVTALMRFSEGPQPHPPGAIPAGAENRVMHASFRVGDSEIYASDGHCGGKPVFQGFSLALRVDGDAAARRAFDALADGGKVNMPLGKTFFASSFGMVADRFGINWIVLAGGRA